MSNGIQEILKELERISQNGFNPYSIFCDWIDIMLYALQEDDKHYLEIVDKYRNGQPKDIREIGNFCKAFALLQLEMKQSNDDILGQVYMQWNIANSHKGQFFTPKHIASLMALISNPKGRILDPACGSGVMLIETIKTMSNEDLNSALFFGQDIDSICVKMTALNLCFFNVNGYVIQGDTLRMECNRVYQTTRSVLGGSIRELAGKDFETFKASYTSALITTIQEQPDKTIPLEVKQFSLFEQGG